MKILLVGSDLHMSIERYYKKYLLEAGADIYHYPAADIAHRRYAKSIFHKVLYRTGILDHYKGVNRELLKIADKYQPDFIWVFKGMELYPETIRQLSGKFTIANYNPDHPFVIESKGSGNRYVTESVPLYHLHFCYNGPLMRQIEEQYKIPCVFLPFGYELPETVFTAAQAAPEINKVCFLGNPDKERADTVLYLAGMGIPVDVYGHGWNKTAATGNPLIGVHDAIYGDEFWKKLRQYRVQLNIFRKHNIGSHNMRTFEIPAVGGIQLAPYSEEHTAFFKEGEECFLYRDREQLGSKVQLLLNMPQAAADRVRQQARSRSLQSGYSYRDRALTVFDSFTTMMAPAV